MDTAFAKAQFKSLMVLVRHLSENADPDLARTMRRELEREIGVLTPKVRVPAHQIEGNHCEGQGSVVQSRPAG